MTQWSYAYASHRGLVRRMNQDNFSVLGQHLPMGGSGTGQTVAGVIGDEEGALFGVFDGMGGEQRGEAASFLAACRAGEIAPAGGGEALLSFCRDANRDICAFTEENGLDTCGTTAVLALARQGRIALCNVGDSRIYRMRRGRLEQMSEDHVMPLPGSQKPPLFQFLGIPETEMQLEPRLIEETVKAGDGYLLCSDGLTDMVTEEEIARVLIASDPSSAVEQLLQRALDQGGKDNVTIVALRAEKRRKRFFPFLTEA